MSYKRALRHLAILLAFGLGLVGGPDGGAAMAAAVDPHAEAGPASPKTDLFDP